MSRQFVKNRREAMIFGVCAGLADTWNLNRFWTRIAFVGLTLLGFGLPLLLYLLIAILAPSA